MDLICVKCEAESTTLVVTQKQSNLTNHHEQNI